MFAEATRVQIRLYLGASRMYLSSDPRLESAITNAQSEADGGAAPDNTTELLILGILTDLGTVETQLKKLWSKAIAVDIEGLKVDAARAMGMLRMEGRRLVGHLADTLRYRPLRDVFSSVAPSDESGGGGGQLQQYGQ